jgi:iron complex outermembrane recepter protein
VQCAHPAVDSDLIISPVKFISESVIAYELGYRVRPIERLSLSLAPFYNQYSNLRSIDKYSGPPAIFANSQRGESWGLEISGIFQATKKWQLRGGYTYFEKKILPTSAAALAAGASLEGIDPRNQFMLQSIMDLPMNLQLDLVGRYVDVLKLTTFVLTPAYTTFDIRLAWKFKLFEFSLSGQNLLEKEHLETGNYKIPRSINGKVICQF